MNNQDGHSLSFLGPPRSRNEDNEKSPPLYLGTLLFGRRKGIEEPPLLVVLAFLL